MTEPEPLQQIDRTYVRFRRRKLSYFSGCDYFRLASHPKVLAAMQQGAKAYGLNVAASRLTTGNHVLYGELEEALADFFGAEATTLVASGYMSNIVAAQALAGSFTHALVDEQAHPSLTDAARFLDCPTLKFKHRDPKDLARLVKRCGARSTPLLLTDGMYSRDGSAAPLAEYLQVLPKSALILVDDAHAAGVLGQTGRGSPEHAGVSRRRIIQTITLSKAFGVYGGAILGTRAVHQRIYDHSRFFVASTPLPLPLASAVIQGIAILKHDQTPRQRLNRNQYYVKDGLRRAGFQIPEYPGPIVALFPKHADKSAKLEAGLLKAGIFPPFIKYPGGPPAGYFRFVISSEHSKEQLDRLLKVLISARSYFLEK